MIPQASKEAFVGGHETVVISQQGFAGEHETTADNGGSVTEKW